MTVRPSPVAPVDKDSRPQFTKPSHQKDLSTPYRSYHSWKRTMDLVFCCALLIPLSFTMIAVALAILIWEGRPIFYSQNRVGFKGRIFRIFKFRTMRPEAESKTGPVWSVTNDRRITTLGRWLRRSHLDELPQIFNVLRGDMSLVGPRPERPEFVEQLKKVVPNYEYRHQVRPGITGLSQLRLGYDTCLHDVAKKTELDLRYIYDRTCFMDLMLLVQTVPYLLGEPPKIETQPGVASNTGMFSPNQLIVNTERPKTVLEGSRPAKTIPRRRADVSARFPDFTTSNSRNLVGSGLARLDEQASPILST